MLVRRVWQNLTRRDIAKRLDTRASRARQDNGEKGTRLAATAASFANGRFAIPEIF